MATPCAHSEPYADTVVISIAPDGRLYFHDLDPALIEVALAVNPGDPLMRRRLDRTREQRTGTTEEAESCPPETL